MSEEKWIDDVLNSLEGADHARAPQDAFEGIQQQINDQERSQKKNYQWIGVAAVILMVLCANALLLTDYFVSEEVAEYEQEYPEMISNYTLYEDEW
ncbi:MAG: hypothetical protein ABJG47_09535 [Ekhidna sp.]